MLYEYKDNRPAIKFSQSLIALVKECQDKNGEKLKPKTPNRSRVFMECLERIVKLALTELNSD
jgi:hypothetical protein